MARLTNLSRAINTLVLLGSLGIATSTGIVYADSSDNLSDDEKAMIMRGEPTNIPFGVGGLGIAPLVMITMGREHNLFTEAYSDYTDLDGDGKLEIMFDPSFDYYGLFDHKYCYKYVDGTTDLTNPPPHNDVRDGANQTTANKFPGYWVPVSHAKAKKVSLSMWADTDKTERTVKYCPASDEWSGNFLSYVTSSRIDVIRKVLYGGARAYSSTKGKDLRSGEAKTTKYKDKYSLLVHSRVVRDSHAWGKVLSDSMYDYKLSVSDFTSLSGTTEKDGIINAYYFLVASPDSKTHANDNDGTDDSMRWSPSYLRFGLVENTAVPGKAPKEGSDPAYIWDWASRQTNSNQNDAIGSESQKRIDRSKKASGSQPTSVDLFTGGVQTRGIAVVACTEEFHDNDSCYNYGTEAYPIWQPSGLLQQYGQGDTPRMKFGLLSGSWQNNIKGGALRANIGDFNKEIHTISEKGHMAGDFDFSILSDPKKTGCTGSNTVCGIVGTLDRMNIAAKEGGFNGAPNGGGVYAKCPRNLDDNLKKMAAESGGRCHDWGNPVGEMLYQTARYFAHSSLTNQGTSYEENQLKMGHVNAADPYPDKSPDYCAKPVSLLIADENISFDSDVNDKSAYDGDTASVVAATKAVSEESNFKAGDYFMGAVRDQADNGMFEFIPSRKHVTDLSQVVGLAPSVAFSFGSYNVAGVASLYSKNPVRISKGPNGEEATLYMSTYVVAMKPNLPQINIPITYTDSSGKQATKTVEILPFAKTPCDSCNTEFTQIGRSDRILQSTNQVADFYVETLGDNEGVFRISYEDFEYGSDYDMDWVVGYKYQVLHSNNGSTYVRIQLTHEDGDPYAPQHAGYVITGVENEGVYIDLGKLSAASNSNCKTNLFELDSVINDASIDSCMTWNLIDDSKGLDSVVKLGAGKDVCLFPSWNYSEASYENHPFWRADLIDNYYNKFIKPNAKIYYGNRRSLYDLGYKQYAEFKDYTVSGKKYNYRLHGDKYSSMGRVVGSANNYDTVTTSRVFKVNTSSSDTGWLKSPLWYAAKYGINPKSSPKRSDPNAEPDNYYLVTNPLKLRDGIAEMLNKIDQSFSSGSSFVIANVPDSVEVTDGSPTVYTYGTSYDASTWYGTLSKVGFDGTTFVYNYSVGWNAADEFAKLTPEDRLIVTADMDASTPKVVRLYAEDIAYNRNGYDDYKDRAKGKGVIANAGYNVFRKLINEDVSDDIIDDNNDYQVFVDKLVRWLAGESKYEGLDLSDNIHMDFAFLNEKPLRPRIEDGEHFVLGDIINSNATIFKVNCNKDGLKCNQFVAVGANDGMLHIIDDLNGKPVVSYVPTVMLPKLVELVRDTYLANAHIPYVDSTPKVYYSKSWLGDEDGQVIGTYLYGTYGLGFSGGYVLDVSNIAAIASKTSGAEKMEVLKSSGDFLVWEISDQDSAYIGRQRKAPAIITMSNAASDLYPAYPFLVYGSGYKHPSDNAGLVIVDMLRSKYADKCSTVQKFRPCIIKEIDIAAEDPWKELYGEGSTSRKNVIAPISDYTTTQQDEFAKNTQAFYYEALYFGDLYGNVWKMDLASLGDDYADVTKWGTDSSAPKVIFKAKDASGKAQQITTQLSLGYHTGGGIGIIFGTGGLWTDADQNLPSKYYNDTQSVYMIRDMNTTNVNLNASNVSTEDSMVKRCSTYVDSPTLRCLFPLKESRKTDGEGHQYINLTRDFSVNQSPKNIYGWYFDLYGFNATDVGLARVYTDILIEDSKYMAVPVNVPNVTDSCGGGGHSYILRGNWSMNPYNINIKSTYRKESLLNEGTMYLDEEGQMSDIFQETPATKQGPKQNDPNTRPTQLSKNASWLRLY